MKYAYIYILLVLVSLTLVLRTFNFNSVDNLITSVSPSIFELSSNIKDEYDEDVDMIDLDLEKFYLLLCEEIKKNKAFYQGKINIELYF